MQLQAIINDYLKSLQPHKEKQEQLKNAFTNLYDSLPNYGPVNRPELDTFQRCLDKLDRTLESKRLNAVKHDIGQHLEAVRIMAANNEHGSAILAKLEALLAVLNRFQENIIVSLQTQQPTLPQPPPPPPPENNHYQSASHDTMLPPSSSFGSSMMQNLLSEASQNNSPELLSPSHSKLSVIKARTKKLREKLDELHADQAGPSETTPCRLQEAREAYLLEMRRLVKSEIIVPLCFAELGEQTYQRLMTECAVTDVIGRHAIMMRDMHALHEWNEDLPLVYIANMCFPAYDPNTESVHGSRDKLEAEKYRAVENLIKSISPNLNEETRQKLANEILHEIRPSRWQFQCQQAVLLVFGCVGLATCRRVESDRGMKTTIDKQGKQITVEIGSRWMIEWSQQSGDKQRDVAMVKATYRITFVTSKSNGIKDEENCGEVKLSISVSSFKHKHPSLFQRIKTKLDTEKHLLACLLSGTFEKDLRNEPQPKAPTKALSMRSLRHELPQAESPQSAPRALHYKQPSEPSNLWSQKNQPNNPLQTGGRQLLPDRMRNMFQSNIISRPTNTGAEQFYQQQRVTPSAGASGATASSATATTQIAPPTSLAQQYKARSWPRNPGTNSFNILSPDDPMMQNDPEMREFAAQINYQPAPAPGVIPDPDPKRYDLYEDETTTLKESLKQSTLGAKDFYSNGVFDLDELSLIESKPDRYLSAPIGVSLQQLNASSMGGNTNNTQGPLHRRTASLTGLKFENWNDGMHSHS